MIGTWNINHFAVDNTSDSYSKTDVIACDGSYLYIHSYGKGLRKIGTGHGGTVRGHIYERNSEYRKKDKQKSLVYLKNKLYYLLPQSSSATATSTTSTTSRPSTSNAPSTTASVGQLSSPFSQMLPPQQPSTTATTTQAGDTAATNKQSAKEEEEEDLKLRVAVIDTVTLKVIPLINHHYLVLC